MSRIIFAIIVALPVLCVAQQWQVITYYPSGGCASGGAFYQTVMRVDNSGSCSSSACVSTSSLGSVSSCCSSSAPQPSSQQMAWTWRDGSLTCTGDTIVSRIFFQLDRCIGYSGSYVKYSKLNDTTVMSLTGCSDPQCTADCSTATYDMGCNSFGNRNMSWSWEFSVGSGSGTQCDGTGGNNLQDGAGASVKPLLLLVFAALLGAAISI
eukprot:TRINITY_DN9739_c0_g1_i1.p1 TRINITY_DN9739_c0_g1~~TRINITY_DN9739_c0_g1_i1.p1  ORF type:complete len:209 (+),score=39.25 TRINITY_DN9739_c0_g1_i1:106-732(+)